MYKPNSIEQLRLEHAQLIVENHQLRHTLYAVRELIDQVFLDPEEGKQEELFTVDEVEKFFLDPKEASDGGVTSMSEILVEEPPKLDLYLQNSEELLNQLSNFLDSREWGIFDEEPFFEEYDEEDEDFASSVINNLDQSLEAVKGLFVVLRDYISDVVVNSSEEEHEEDFEEDQW